MDDLEGGMPPRNPMVRSQHMNSSSSRVANLVASLLTSATLAAQAQSWVTVLDPAHGGPAGSSSDITADTSGNLFAVGSTTQTTDGTMRALVLGSGDAGATWEVLDQYAEPGLNYAHNRAIATNPLTGGLLAGGNLNHLLPDGSYQYGTLWFLREWNPTTGAWSVAEDATHLAGDIGQASCADLLITPSGDVYATGGGDLGLIVRKRPVGGTAFATVHADYSGQTAGAGWDLGFHPVQGAFAVGDANSAWTVRRSTTGNAGTWAAVDTFKTSEWTVNTARSIVATRSGSLHVAGWGYSSKTRRNHWLVRSSYNGGATWSLSDTYSYGGTSVYVSGITEDSAGNLLVSGQVADSAGNLWWLVRQGVPGTKLVKQGGKWVTVPTISWTNSDLYRLASGQPARALGLTVAPDGSAFASGWANDAAGAKQWIVRKLAP